jgi:hypothetical protein
MSSNEILAQPPPPPLSAIDRGALPTADVVARVRRVQEIMGTLMKDGTHYGTIPGTPKPTLFQPGAELLCMTFRVAPEPQVEDLSTGDAVRYRVTVRGVNQQTGEILGSGVGECSSDEEKYRWRRPVCDEEFAETPEDLRREKWARGKNGNYKTKQIRTSPADIANTVLKMAFKRAMVSMTRVVLACSDIFAQDLEDLPVEVREAVVGAETEHKPDLKPPQRKSDPAPTSPAQTSPPAGATIVAVEERSGTTKAGKPYVLFIVKLSDGREGTTFDTAIRDAAVALRESKASVDVTIEGENGHKKIVELSPAVA